MQDELPTWRQCPTRPDGQEVLIEQRISNGSCQDRQHRHYHKCHACVHRNGAYRPMVGSLPRPEPIVVVQPAPRQPERPAAAAPKPAAVERVPARPKREPVGAGAGRRAG